jgi:hypothetical protein
MEYRAPENDLLDQVLRRDRGGLISAASFNQGSVRSRAPGPQ